MFIDSIRHLTSIYLFRNIKTVGVSAVTGEGMSKLFTKIDECGMEFKESYLPDLARYEYEQN